MNLRWWLSSLILLAAGAMAPGCLTSPSSSQTSPDGAVRTWPERQWRPAIRDIWIDGRLAPEVSCYRNAEAGLLLLAADGWRQWLVVAERDEPPLALEVDGAGDEPAWQSERRTAPRPVSTLGPVATPAAGQFFLAWRSRSVLITPHQGLAGPIDRQTLFDRLPDWRQRAERYEPEPTALAELARVEQPVTLEVTFGTWCSDSRREVPALLRTLEAADNARLALDLVAVTRHFAEPVGWAQQRGITNVPTVRVLVGGREIGRFVESPVGSSIEEDLAAILAGRRPSAAAAQRQIVASGVLAETSAATTPERFTIEADDSGRLSIRSTSPDRDVETLLHLDGGRKPGSFQVTWGSGRQAVRLRGWQEGDLLEARVRGQSVGIQRQSTFLPSGSLVLLPTLAARAAALAAAGAPEWCYRVGTASGPLGVQHADIRLEDLGRQTVRVPAGEFRARHLRLSDGTGSSEWWLHPRLPIALRVRHDDGRVVEAQRLDLLAR